MTSNEFVTWLKGFAAAKRNDQITGTDWEIIIDELDQVTPPSNTPYSPTYPAGVVNHTEVPIFTNSFTTTLDERIL